MDTKIGTGGSQERLHKQNWVSVIPMKSADAAKTLRIDGRLMNL